MTLIIIAVILVLGIVWLFSPLLSKAKTDPFNQWGISYSESVGMKKMDWHKALNSLEADLSLDLSHEAFEWSMCAVGVMPATIPRDANGRPIDRMLSRLGAEFASQVAYRQIDRARQLLIAIEQRALELCDDITHGKQTINPPDATLDWEIG